MRRGRAVRILLLVAGTLPVVGTGVYLMRRPSPATPSPATPSPAMTRAELDGCLGLPAGHAVERLRLGDAEWYWTQEPPGTLRGVSYSSADGRRVTLYIAEGERMFREFSDRSEWDYGAFLRCQVGGIQYESGGVHFDIGPAVPWQWRLP